MKKALLELFPDYYPEPDLACPSCRGAITVLGTHVSDYFDGSEDVCPLCDAEVGILGRIRATLDQSGGAGLALWFGGAFEVVFRTTLEVGETYEVDLCALGIPDDADVLRLVVRPQDADATLLAITPDRVLPLTPELLSQFYVLSDDATGSVLFHGLVMWSRTEDIAADNLLHALNAWEAATPVPEPNLRASDQRALAYANAAVERHYAHALESSFAPLASERRKTLHNLGHLQRLTFLVPLACQMLGVPALPAKAEDQLLKLNGRRNKLFHGGQPAPLSHEEAGEMLAAAVLGYWHASLMLESVRERDGQ